MPSKKIDLVEPIYKIQEDETPKQYWFANEYYHFDGSQNDFLDFFYTSEGEPRCIEVAPSGAKIPFKLPAKRRTMQSWMIIKRWYERKKAYWAYIIEETQQGFQKDILNFFKGDVKNLIKSSEKDWDLDKKIDKSRKVNPHMKARGKSDLAKAHAEKVGIMLTEAGMPKDFTKNDSTVKVDAEITSKKENYLFVNELIDYNLDDALNEVTENVDRNQSADN